MLRAFRRAAILAPLLLSTAWSPVARAGGWQEMHETSDDVEVSVGADGTAIVQHHLRYRIVAGHFKTVDLAGIDPRAEIAPEAVLTNEKGGAQLPVRVETVAKTPGTIRLFIDDGKGLSRGAYVVDVKYKLDLVATRMLGRDGALWKLSWTAPPAAEGHDGARVVFDLPAAPTEPRLAAPAETTTTLATLKRTADRDALELVRAHVPRGEAVTWSARVDPKAFPGVVDPELRPAKTPEVAPASFLVSNFQRGMAGGVVVLVGVLLALLLRAKQRGVRRAAELSGAIARPVLAVPWSLGPVTFGLAGAGALVMLLWSSPAIGALLVAGAMTLAAHRDAAPIPRARRAGKWTVVAASRALALPEEKLLPSDPLDLSTRIGKVAFASIVVFVAGVALILRSRIPQSGIAIPLVATALLPIFVTGTRAQLPKRPTELAARILRPARDALARAVDLAHVDVRTIGRAVAPSELDEVRLACAPRDGTPGLVDIELALACCPGGRGAVPEVLLRFGEGSAAADRITRLAPATRRLRGRTKDERVVRLAPEEPTAAAAASLVAELLASLEGRRATDRTGSSPARRAWQGRERRRVRPGVVPARPC